MNLGRAMWLKASTRGRFNTNELWFAWAAFNEGAPVYTAGADAVSN